MKKIITLLVFIGISTTISAQSWWNSKKIRGNGNVTTETRKTSDYDGIDVGGSFDVMLVKGKEGNIKIEGEENIIPYIVTEVRGNTLKVRFEKNINVRTTRRLTVTVPFKDIEKISLGGSGNVKAKDIVRANYLKVNLGGSGNISAEVEAGELRSSIGGSGNINLSGKAREFDCSIAGSGSIRAYDLETDELQANIAGSGSIKTTVKNKIDARVVGSGSIYYKGNPKKIKTKSLGSGDVIDRN